MIRVESEGYTTKVFEDDKEIQYVTALKVDFGVGSLPKATMQCALPIFKAYAMPEYEIQSLANYPTEFLNKLACAIQEEIKSRGSL